MLKPSQTRLSAYSGHYLTTLGEMEVVSYLGQHETLPILVVAGAGPSLFGRNWLTTIRLDWKSIGAIAHLAQLLGAYSEVFREGLGKLIGHEATIQVDPTAQPRYCKARTIPYALRSKVEAELERLQGEGIIETVQLQTGRCQ